MRTYINNSDASHGNASFYNLFVYYTYTYAAMLLTSNLSIIYIGDWCVSYIIMVILNRRWPVSLDQKWRGSQIYV